VQHNGKKKLAHEVIIQTLKDLVSQIQQMDGADGPDDKKRFACEIIIDILGQIKLQPEHRDWVLAELKELAPDLHWEDLNQLIVNLYAEKQLNVLIGLLNQIHRREILDQYADKLEQMSTNPNLEDLDQLIAQLRAELEADKEKTEE